MRICFIADSSSIHVKRIISYHVRKQDEILVLSSSTWKSDIMGAETIHVLCGNESWLEIYSDVKKREKTYMAAVKRVLPSSVKGFIKRTIRDIRVVSKGKSCLKEIERFDPEVIFSHRSFPEGVLASRCKVRPFVLRTAGPDISKLPQYPIYRQMIRKAINTADVVVTESVWERQLLRDLCGDGMKVDVNIIGVDCELFRPTRTRDSVRQKYGLPQDAFVAVTNRYLDGHYNGWRVVQAVEAVLEQCPNLILLYASPSKLGPRAKAQAESISSRFPRIRFLDGPSPYSEMPDMLGCADIYISFSSFDGIPNSVLEAMACGVVPIVADLAQLREWVDDGVSGYFVRQHDTNGLASMVKEVYTNRQALSDMSVRCVWKIREHGSYEGCMKRTRDLMSRLISTVPNQFSGTNLCV